MMMMIIINNWLAHRDISYLLHLQGNKLSSLVARVHTAEINVASTVL